MDNLLTHKQEILKLRARIVQAIRAFFVAADFLEVETPQRIPTNAPEVQIIPQESGDWQLQTSPELAMKRLLAAGYSRIFQISHCWRKEERGSRHLPEFTLLEWYRAHCDYTRLMIDCEDLLRSVLPAQQFTYQEHSIDLKQPFERLSVDQAFSLYTDTTPRQAIADDRFDELIALTIEPRLGLQRPTILYDYPLELGALARNKPGQPYLAERFELYVAGLELANAFSELTDPQEQRQRFALDAKIIYTQSARPANFPEPFLKDLAQMPASAGIALGIDRLIMLLTNSSRIDQVVAFTPADL
ncbi:EF-P lysine aminoacylase EpmA [Geopsychrobacter electrodiphilus]|uniref:EF-P lysine aminoacylase EpmA n=1 Tax=Geopsychrobacter electrodiphilus TaxID=225196 RepID=UPI00035CB10B|nr:EF-P lysine aminoacylase EpmA [Geopsychrobacter electrodiphilus]